MKLMAFDMSLHDELKNTFLYYRLRCDLKECLQDGSRSEEEHCSCEAFILNPSDPRTCAHAWPRAKGREGWHRSLSSTPSAHRSLCPVTAGRTPSLQVTHRSPCPVTAVRTPSLQPAEGPEGCKGRKLVPFLHFFKTCFSFSN